MNIDGGLSYGKISDEDIHIAVGLLQDDPEVLLNINDPVIAARVISQEFECICTAAQIINYLDPTLEEIELDYKLIYENCVE